MTALAGPFASSTDAPDLGGEAGGALVVTDGSSKSGYRSRHKATPQSCTHCTPFPMMLQRGGAALQLA